MDTNNITTPEQLRDYIIKQAQLTGMDNEYTLYYDETNNVGSIHIDMNGQLNTPVHPFVLGGGGYVGTGKTIDIEALRDDLAPFFYGSSKMPADELKYASVCGGSFMKDLSSEKVSVFLEFLNKNDLFLHCSIIDPLYWCAEQIVGACSCPSALTERDRQIAKNALHRLFLTETAQALGAVKNLALNPFVIGGQRALRNLLTFASYSDNLAENEKKILYRMYWNAYENRIQFLYMNRILSMMGAVAEVSSFSPEEKYSIKQILQKVLVMKKIDVDDCNLRSFESFKKLLNYALGSRQLSSGEKKLIKKLKEIPLNNEIYRLFKDKEGSNVSQRGVTANEVLKLSDKRGEIIIESFAPFYLQPIFLFKNATHRLDEVDRIEGIFNTNEAFKALGELGRNYKFCDSKLEGGIQVSDILVGIVGKMVTYLRNASVAQIKQLRQEISQDERTEINLKKRKKIMTRRKNLGLLRGLFERSISLNPAFIHYGINTDIVSKLSLLLVDDRLVDVFTLSQSQARDDKNEIASLLIQNVPASFIIQSYPAEQIANMNFIDIIQQDTQNPVYQFVVDAQLSLTANKNSYAQQITKENETVLRALHNMFPFQRRRE